MGCFSEPLWKRLASITVDMKEENERIRLFYCASMGGFNLKEYRKEQGQW